MARSPYDFSGTDEGGDTEDGVWGWDDAHLVGVELSPDGEVMQVSVANDWKSTIAPDDLAHVVFAVYNVAERERLDRQAGADLADVTADVAEPPQVPVELTLQVIAVQAEYLEEYQRSLEQVQEFRDDSGNVTVSASGGSVAGIAFDRQWLGFTSAADIAESVREPLNRAIRTGQVIDAHMERQYPEVAEFRRLQSQRNAALLRR